ncbi:MAG: lysophospholipase [Anaerolineales bacterium]|nr:lysophospholipase [Anaerolineales bacterium]
MIHSEGTVTASDGINLYTQTWLPEKEIIGRVLIVHGMGEHSGRYPHVAKILTAAGFRVDSSDLRGHGKSAGARGHSPSYQQLQDDIRLMLDQDNTTPVFLYGHSMGGNLVLNYGLQQPPLRGIVATGPLLCLTDPPGGATMLIVKVSSVIKPDLTINSGLDASGLTHDEKVNQAYRDDPLVHPKISVNHFKGIHQAGLDALAHAAEFKTPLLLIHGEKDPICDPESSKVFFTACSSEDKTLKIWPDLFHEVHNEPEQVEVISLIRDWLLERC